jgi:hypothetical protein
MREIGDKASVREEQRKEREKRRRGRGKEQEKKREREREERERERVGEGSEDTHIEHISCCTLLDAELEFSKFQLWNGLHGILVDCCELVSNLLKNII